MKFNNVYDKNNMAYRKNFDSKMNVMSNQKKISMIVSIILVMMLLFTSTFAWRDYNQHKSNEFRTAVSEHNVVLVEDFQSTEDWSVNNNEGVITKEVYVKNGQTAQTGLDEAFIRLSIREYMEINKLQYQYSDKRYMIDTQGEFIRVLKDVNALDAPSALIKMQALLNDKNINIEVSEDDLDALNGYFDEGYTYWYLMTHDNDPNGQYGKHLVLNQTTQKDQQGMPLPPEKISVGIDRVPESQVSDEASHHSEQSHPECGYTAVDWQEVNFGTADDVNQYAIREGVEDYVRLGIDRNNVMTYQEWVNAGKQPVNKWILDTTDTAGTDSNTGYMYWGQALHSGTQTSRALDSVQLIKQPRDRSYYNLHVDMQAFSQDEVVKMNDIPEALKTMYEQEIYRGEINVTLMPNEVNAGTPERMEFQGFYFDGSVIQMEDFIITIQGSNHPTYNQVTKTIETSVLEKGVDDSGKLLVTITVKGMNSLKFQSEIKLNKIDIVFPNLVEDHIVAPGDIIELHTEPFVGELEYEIISLNHNENTKFEGTVLVIDKDELQDEIIFVIKKQGEILNTTTLKLQQISSIRIDVLENMEMLAIGSQIPLDLEVKGNKYLRNKDFNVEIYSLERTSQVKGITYDAEHKLLRVSPEAVINQEVVVSIRSDLKPSIQKDYAFTVGVESDDISVIEINLEKENLRPLQSSLIKAEFYADSNMQQILTGIDYEVKIESLISPELASIASDKKTLILGKDFREEHLDISVTAIGINSEIKAKKTFEFNYLVDMLLTTTAVDHEIMVGTNDALLNIDFDGIGSYNQDVKISHDYRDQEKIKFIRINQETYQIQMDKAVATDEPITITVSVVDDNTLISKNITIFPKKNQLLETTPVTIKIKESMPSSLMNSTVDYQSKIDLKEYVEVRNIYGNQIDNPNIEFVLISGSSIANDSYIDKQSILMIGQNQKEQTLKIHIKSSVDSSVIGNEEIAIAITPFVEKIKIGSQEVGKDFLEFEKNSNDQYQLNTSRQDVIKLSTIPLMSINGVDVELMHPKTTFMFENNQAPSLNTTLADGVLSIDPNLTNTRFKIIAMTQFPNATQLVDGELRPLDVVVNEIVVNNTIKSEDLELEFKDIVPEVFVFEPNQLSLNLGVNIKDRITNQVVNEDYQLDYAISPVNFEDTDDLYATLKDGVLEVSGKDYQQKEMKIIVTIAIKDEVVTPLTKIVTLKPKADKIVYTNFEDQDVLIADEDVHHFYQAYVEAFNKVKLSDKVSYELDQTHQKSSIDEYGLLTISKAELEGDLLITMNSNDGIFSTDLIHVIPRVHNLEITNMPSSLETYRPGALFDLKPKAFSVANHELKYPQGHFICDIVVNKTVTNLEDKSDVATINSNGVVQLSSLLETDDRVVLRIGYKNKDNSIIYSEEIMFNIQKAGISGAKGFPTQQNPVLYNTPHQISVQDENNKPVEIKSVKIDSDKNTTTIDNSNNEFKIIMSNEETAAYIPLIITTIDDEVYSLNAPARTISGLEFVNLPANNMFERNKRTPLRVNVEGNNLDSKSKIVNFDVVSDNADINIILGQLRVGAKAKVFDEFEVSATTMYGNRIITEKMQTTLNDSEQVKAIDLELENTSDLALEYQSLIQNESATIKVHYYSDLAKTQEIDGLDALDVNLSVVETDQELAYLDENKITISNVVVKDTVEVQLDHEHLPILIGDVNVSGVRSVNINNPHISLVNILESKNQTRDNFEVSPEDFNANIETVGKARPDILQLKLIATDSEFKEDDHKIMIQFDAPSSVGVFVNQFDTKYSIVSVANPSIKKEVLIDVVYQAGDKILFGQEIDSDADKVFDVVYVADEDQPTLNNKKLENIKQGMMIIMPEYALRESEFNLLGFKDVSDWAINRTGNGPDYMAFKYLGRSKSSNDWFPKAGYNGTGLYTGDQELNPDYGLKMVLDGYGNKFMEVNQNLSKYILEYQKPNEYGYPKIKENWKSLQVTDRATQPKGNKELDPDTAIGTMFALGMSDLNTYLVSKRSDTHIKFLDTGQYYWLSSAGKSLSLADSIIPRGQIYTDFLYTRTCGARGAFFVDFNN